MTAPLSPAGYVKRAGKGPPGVMVGQLVVSWICSRGDRVGVQTPLFFFFLFFLLELDSNL